MEPIAIEEVSIPIIIRFNGEDVKLPPDIQQKIDAYWDELITSGRPYKRGEIFTVTEVNRTAEALEIGVVKSDYAHYLYCQNVGTLGEHGVRIIHTAGPLITKDNYIIFGEMGPQTARAGTYQLCGGGLDADSLQEDGILDPDDNISREFQEEFGVGVSDKERVKSFTKKYLKTGGPTGKMTIIYVVELTETRDEFLAKYNQFEAELKAQGELPEFSKIVTFSLEDTQNIRTFIQNDEIKMDEYLRPFLKYLLFS